MYAILNWRNALSKAQSQLHLECWLFTRMPHSMIIHKSGECGIGSFVSAVSSCTAQSCEPINTNRHLSSDWHTRQRVFDRLAPSDNTEKLIRANDGDLLGKRRSPCTLRCLCRRDRRKSRSRMGMHLQRWIDCGNQSHLVTHMSQVGNIVFIFSGSDVV